VADEITQEIFQHLVDLAALELDAEEAEYLLKELNGQLKAVRELEAIDVDSNIETTSHGVPYTEKIRPALREDRIEAFGNPEAIMEQAPDVEDNYLVVPVIPHTELE